MGDSKAFLTIHRKEAGYRPVHDRIHDFGEVEQTLNSSDRRQQASRCMDCGVPFCHWACPLGNRPPEWNDALYRGDWELAYRLLNSTNDFPEFTGRVCPALCEKACVLNLVEHEPTTNREDEAAITEHAFEENYVRIHHPGRNGRCVAVIGSGPAGLTIAGDLARQGFNIEIFEMEPEPGGVLMFGIPEYRLPKEVVRREIKKIEELGVVFHCNTTIGTDLNIDQLFEQGFDAIFMGTGTVKPRKPDIPGRNLRGVRQAVYFLRKVSLYNEGSIERDDVPVQEGDRVFVLGCGNTAMDAARTAIRMGARDVEIIYHHTINEMSALRSEYEEAVSEGVKFNWESNLVEILDYNGTLSGVVIEHDGQRRTEKADKVLMAIGSVPASRIVSTTKGIDVDESGYVLTREKPCGMTSRKGVFAGGDVVNRPSTVVLAMRDAKKVAEGIAQYVDAIKLLEAINLSDNMRKD